MNSFETESRFVLRMNLTNEIFYTLYNNIENPNFLAKKLELELNVSISNFYLSIHFSNTITQRSGPENFKKSRQKKLVKLKIQFHGIFFYFNIFME